MHMLLVASILLVRTVIRAPTDGLSSGDATPRATDLFRAKRLANEAAGRLQAHPSKRGGWVRGGGGWERSTGTPEPAPEPKLPTRKRVR